MATQSGSASQSLKSQLRQAGRLEVPYVAILGDDELAAGTVTLRDMRGGTQERVARDTIVETVASAVSTGVAR
ncbi:MAG: His/Gly/Thr/Pro-type tRNA ligase C-terminal domain-containing protein [Dehalococcoidia bacterium]